MEPQEFQVIDVQIIAHTTAGAYTLDDHGAWVDYQNLPAQKGVSSQLDDAHYKKRMGIIQEVKQDKGDSL